jgi:soluble lytic murein transglycosylase-like protein
MSRLTNRRLALLFLVAVASAAVAAFAGNTAATAGKPFVPPFVPQAHAPAAHRTRCPLPRSLRPAFDAAARDTGLPLAMLVAVARVESNLRANARSEAGARGLLQLMPATGSALELNIDDPEANVLAGARYLQQLLDRFRSTDLALAAYNAGPTAVATAAGIPWPGVSAYVVNVTTLWRSIAGCA